MKVDAMAATVGGFMTSAVVVAQEFGTTPLAVGLAIVGAGLAVIEMEGRTWGKAVVVLVFNVIVGLMAAPLIVDMLEMPNAVALALVSFLGGYFSHDMIGRILETTIKKRLGGK